MGGKNKNHPHHNAKQKQKKAAKDDRTPNYVGLAFHHALSNGWVQNAGIAFLLTFVALIVTIMMSSQVKAAAITFASVGTAFVWILALVAVRYSVESTEFAFSLLFTTFDGSRDPTRGVFWVRYTSGYGDTLSPASAALYVTIKNLTGTPAYVERLEVSVQKKGESWSPLRDIPIEGRRLYWIFGDSTKAKLLNMPALSQRLHSSVPPGETLPGWVFLATTEEYRAGEGDMIRWRIRAKDSAGEPSEYISPYEAINNKPPIDMGMNQPVPIVNTGVQEDLSKLVIRIYEPLPYK